MSRHFLQPINYDFIDKKIDDIRWGTDSGSAPSYTVRGSSNFNQFKTVNIDFVAKIIRKSPTKHCNLDTIPTRLVKDCLIISAVHHTCCQPFSSQKLVFISMELRFWQISIFESKMLVVTSTNLSNSTFDSDIYGHPTDQQLRDFQNRLLQQYSCGPRSLSDGVQSVYSEIRSQNYLR